MGLCWERAPGKFFITLADPIKTRAIPLGRAGGFLLSLFKKAISAFWEIKFFRVVKNITKTRAGPIFLLRQTGFSQINYPCSFKFVDFLRWGGGPPIPPQQGETQLFYLFPAGGPHSSA